MSEPFDDALAHLEGALGHSFANPALLREALTHRSTTTGRDELGYERLEFLGDRVLGLCVAHMLYRHFPREAEGKLAVRHTDLVRRETLAEVARSIDLGAHIVMSRDAECSGARENATVLSDVMEAVLAALFLDGGLAAAESCVERLWSQRMRETQRPPRDAKTRLQEWALGHGLPLPIYAMLERTGPDHAPTITVSCAVQGLGESRAQGGSKRAAEQCAAEELLARAQQGDKP
jgi:ribonuclease-3